MKKILIANRGEIAIRVMRAANELGIATVAVFAREDKLSLHRFKADEAYLIGEHLGPVKAYLSGEEILRVAKDANVDGIHPGYGFLSENPDFADAVIESGLIWIGPQPDVMRSVGNKISAREIAVQAGTPVMPASGPLGTDMDEARKFASNIGYPVMLKASWGGGGRGIRVVRDESDLEAQIIAGRREAEAAFGNGEVYLEKLIERARHVEVQVLGDKHGNCVHLFERDCSIQRRNQKVVERAPAAYLGAEQRGELCQSALAIAREVQLQNAATFEFLMDADTDLFYFIEVNPRVQVEHTVTEEVTGVDIVKSQIKIAQGGKIGEPSSGVPKQEDIVLSGHAIQCRVTSEDPDNNFVPDYGRITNYRGANGFGIRRDGGTSYTGAVITRYYDSLLEKVTAWAPTPEEAISRMARALREFRVRGVATNIAFVENLINHPKFNSAEVTTRFLDDNPELFNFPKRRDRATRLLKYIAEVTVNGNPEVKGRPKPLAHVRAPIVPQIIERGLITPGTKTLLERDGPEAVAKWMLAQKQVLITDTSMRDAHQSLLATRLRTHDIIQVSHAYANRLPQLFSLECWGGATFDVSMRFLKECPWERLELIRDAVPNVLLQMLLRGANGVGYTSYPDNVVTAFVRRAASSGVDVFRVFDSLNWIENMRISMDAVLEEGKVLEAAICYTGDIDDPARKTYSLDYYVDMAGRLKDAGTHIIGIKDMAGLLKPNAAFRLVEAIKNETGLPLHLHTHDTSGISGATVLSACRAGVDAVDAAMDSLSSMTSQPSLGSIVEALCHLERDTGLSPSTIREFSDYWDGVRSQYAAFEADNKAGASEVFSHAMPGGQYTNLKEQANAMGLSERWREVAKTYADVNQMFGDVVKVTPTSKVVGDMALTMVASGLTRADVEDPTKEISFPDSVVSFFRGELGQPPNGFPKALQAKVLRGEAPLTERPGASLPPADLGALKSVAETRVGREISDEELNSYTMYPEVFAEYVEHRNTFGPVSKLPTDVFFYGMSQGDEITVEIERGKSLVITYLATGETDEDGSCKVFFELNGQPRRVKVDNRAVAQSVEKHPKADPSNPHHVAAPLPGMVSSVAVSVGAKVQAGDLLLSIESMKMETALNADKPGTITHMYASAGMQIDAKDLLLEISDE